MKNILVTGRNGQLGSEFQKIALKYPNINFFFKGKELDISKKKIIENYLTKKKINNPKTNACANKAYGKSIV